MIPGSSNIQIIEENRSPADIREIEQLLRSTKSAPDHRVEAASRPQDLDDEDDDPREDDQGGHGLAGRRPAREAGYVWTTELGTPISASNFVRRHFKPLCERAGIPTGPQPDGRRGFRFHDMRHSTASIMAARGERPEVIQRVMRHSKVSFTIDRYVKVYRDDLREAVQRNDVQAAAR